MKKQTTSMADFDVSTVAAIKDAVAEATGTVLAPSRNQGIARDQREAPRQLPTGWILKESRSNPGFFYFFNIPTGLASWYPPTPPKERENESDTLEQQDLKHGMQNILGKETTNLKHKSSN